MRGLNPVLAVFAIIGALIVLGIILKIAFALIGLVIAVGIVLVLVYFIRNMIGGGNARR